MNGRSDRLSVNAHIRRLLARPARLGPAPEPAEAVLGGLARLLSRALRPWHPRDSAAGGGLSERGGMTPKSLHAALSGEAEAEDVSLNELVLAKLALQVR